MPCEFDRGLKSDRKSPLQGPWVAVCRALFAIPAALSLAAPLSVCAEHSLEDRRLRLEAMPAEDKYELARKAERFRRLPAADKQRLRQLQAELSGDPEAERLHTVLVRYNDWLKTLSAGERAELLGLPPDERVERIKQLKQQQEAQHFGGLVSTNLPPADVQVLLDWLDQFIEGHEEAIIAALPAEFQERAQQFDDPVKRRHLLRFAMLVNRRRNNGPMPNLQDLQRLTGQLSAEAQSALEKARDPRQKATLVEQWVRAAVFARSLQTVRPASDEQLRIYMERLEPAQRETLENMPREQMRHELQRLYYIQRFKKSVQTQRAVQNHMTPLE
jgi:hypothetical protein